MPMVLTWSKVTVTIPAVAAGGADSWPLPQGISQGLLGAGPWAEQGSMAWPCVLLPVKQARSGAAIHPRASAGSLPGGQEHRLSLPRTQGRGPGGGRASWGPQAHEPANVGVPSARGTRASK